MSSFIDVINKLKAGNNSLPENTALQNFCVSKWKNELTVIDVFKSRAEINMKELPIIMITRPSVKKSFQTNITRDTNNIVRLYCLFYQTDKTKALAELIEFEELIDDALTTPEPETLGALNINPLESVNDEGIYHPNYAILMDVEIKHRR